MAGKTWKINNYYKSRSTDRCRVNFDDSNRLRIKKKRMQLGDCCSSVCRRERVHARVSFSTAEPDCSSTPCYGVSTYRPVARNMVEWLRSVRARTTGVTAACQTVTAASAVTCLSRHAAARRLPSLLLLYGIIRGSAAIQRKSRIQGDARLPLSKRILCDQWNELFHTIRQRGIKHLQRIRFNNYAYEI